MLRPPGWASPRGRYGLPFVGRARSLLGEACPSSRDLDEVGLGFEPWSAGLPSWGTFPSATTRRFGGSKKKKPNEVRSETRPARDQHSLGPAHVGPGPVITRHRTVSGHREGGRRQHTTELPFGSAHTGPPSPRLAGGGTDEPEPPSYAPGTRGGRFWVSAREAHTHTHTHTSA